MPQRITLEVINQIKELRTKGHSLPEIANQVGVSRTSVLRYIKNIQILPEYLNEWAGKRGGSRKRRLLGEKSALEEARKLITGVSPKEKLLFLSALYWAEGNKKDLILTNTDPNLVRVFMEAAREVLAVTEDRFQISIRIYEDIDRAKSLLFWSEVTKIAKEKFINVHVLNGKKLGKLSYGMCRVRISKGANILKKIMSVNQVVTEMIIVPKVLTP